MAEVFVEDLRHLLIAIAEAATPTASVPAYHPSKGIASRCIVFHQQECSRCDAHERLSEVTSLQHAYESGRRIL